MQSYMLSPTEVAYLAGLFDGEGCAQYKQYWVKKKNKKNPAYCWFIRMELAMTDEKTVKYVHDSLKIGWCGTRKVKPGRKHSGVGPHLIVEQTKLQRCFYHMHKQRKLYYKKL